MVVHNIKMYVERVTIIVMITVIASLIPNFLAFMNFVGAVGSTFLAFIIPSTLYLKVVGRRNMSTFAFLFNVFIILFGIIGGGYSAYIALVDLIESS
jgi:amino acid permease